MKALHTSIGVDGQNMYACCYEKSASPKSEIETASAKDKTESENTTDETECHNERRSYDRSDN